MSWHIDSTFPGANACAAAVSVHDGEAAISIAADPGDGPESLWFRIRLRRLDAGAQPPWLLLRHSTTMLGGGDGSLLQPVARCDGGPWSRLASGTPVAHADGRIDACWRLPRAAACIEVAFCFPYDGEDLDRLVGDAGLRVQAVGVSERGRPLLRVDNGPGEVGSARPGLFVIARQHSGETPGSWVLDGLLRRIAELGERAPLTWAVPFADIDGVAEGRYGKDRHPIDHNRAWPGPDSNPRRHETLCWIQDIERWQRRCSPRLLLDLHAPGAGERDGVYAYTTIGADERPAVPLLAWAERLRSALGDLASADFARIGRYPDRWPRDTHLNFGRWAVQVAGLPALSLETPYQGTGDHAFGMSEYRAIGVRLADAVTAGGTLSSRVPAS